MATQARRKQPWEQDLLLRVWTKAGAEKPFCVGLAITEGYCTAAAPILAFCVGRSAPWIYGHILHRGWYSAVVLEPTAPEPVAAAPQLSLRLA
jgi:hypothetical protein